MELLPRLVIFPLILFISCTLWVGTATNCGGKEVTDTITVDQSGQGAFKTVQAAIDSIKQNNDRWVKVHINAGTYTEKVEIPQQKPCIILEGAGKEATTITYGDHQVTTFSTVPVNVVVSGITFKNSYNVPRSSNFHYSIKPSILPALAARIHGDKVAFYNCSFLGFQDTLYDQKGRHYLKDCYIQGEIDFIFGGGQSYYEDCVINATQGVSPPGFITAQRRRSENDTSGYVFRGGSVVGSGQVNLGRAYGPYSRVIFYGTYFSSVVSPIGWNAWNFTGQESKFTYAEVECTGPGANTSQRVPWEKKLNSSQLNEFSLSSFINSDGWLSNLPISIL